MATVRVRGFLREDGKIEFEPAVHWFESRRQEAGSITPIVWMEVMMDALIAAPAFCLQLPLYTRNTKHFLPMIPSLVQQPY